MTGINHALTGTFIGLAVASPLALPLAFASHFALDALPHFGQPVGKRGRLSKTVWAVDTILTSILLGMLIYSHLWFLLVCALLALSPDFAWIYKFTIKEKFGKLPQSPKNTFNKLHAGIQKFESTYGLIFELALLTLYLNWLILR